MDENRFKINKFLSLELWGNKTFIYIGGKKFRQCKYALLNILIEEVDKYSSIDSIDEILDQMNHSLEEHPEIIPPEVEFWAHCSNLQAWAENDYNTDLLDSLLSFPLLKKLTEEGDPKAKRVFKEEIAKRLMRGDLNTAGYLINEKYLEFLSYDEISTLFSATDNLLFNNIFDAFQDKEFERFNEINQIYLDVGKYMFPSIEKKLHEALEIENLEDLYTILQYRMLDVLSKKEIFLLFEPPMNLFERVLDIINKIDLKEIKIEELFSERVEDALGESIQEKLLKVINEKRINFFVLRKIDALKYLENSETDYIDKLMFE